MSPGMATGMENAVPVLFRSFQFQGVLRVEESDRGGQVYRLEPELRWGLIQHGFLSLRVSFALEEGNRRRSGNAMLQGFYNLNRETSNLPATAIVIGTTLPTGIEAPGIGGLARGIVSKTVGRIQFNLNAELAKLTGVADDERQLRYTFGIGADYRIDRPNLLRSALFVEQAEKRLEEPQWRLQLGVFHAITGAIALAIGAEAGLTPSAPAYQFTIGYQQTFQLQ